MSYNFAAVVCRSACASLTPSLHVCSTLASRLSTSPPFGFAFCGLSSLAARPARRSSTAQSADERARTAAGCTRRAQDQEARAPHDTLSKVTVPLPRLGAHISTYEFYDSEPVHPGPHPSRKDGLLAQDPKGGDGDRELLRFSKRRCEIEPGARDAPTSAREGASPRVQG